MSDAAAAAVVDPGSAGNVLEAVDVRKEFGGLIAVNDVNFTVPRSVIAWGGRSRTFGSSRT